MSNREARSQAESERRDRADESFCYYYTPIMTPTTLTAQNFVNQSLLRDIKEICGEHFELISPQLRLSMLSTLTQFQLFKQMGTSSFVWILMEEAADNVPPLVWLGCSEIKSRLLSCWKLDDSAISYLIQQLAENL